MSEVRIFPSQEWKDEAGDCEIPLLTAGKSLKVTEPTYGEVVKVGERRQYYCPTMGLGQVSHSGDASLTLELCPRNAGAGLLACQISSVKLASRTSFSIPFRPFCLRTMRWRLERHRAPNDLDFQVTLRLFYRSDLLQAVSLSLKSIQPARDHRTLAQDFRRIAVGCAWSPPRGKRAKGVSRLAQLGVGQLRDLSAGQTVLPPPARSSFFLRCCWDRFRGPPLGRYLAPAAVRMSDSRSVFWKSTYLDRDLRAHVLLSEPSSISLSVRRGWRRPCFVYLEVLVVLIAQFLVIIVVAGAD